MGSDAGIAAPGDSEAIDRAELEAVIRQVLADEGLLAEDAFSLAADSGLRSAGLTSLRMVQLVMALEEKFATVIPDSSLSRNRLGNIGAVVDLIHEVVAEGSVQASASAPEA